MPGSLVMDLGKRGPAVIVALAALAFPLRHVTEQHVLVLAFHIGAVKLSHRSRSGLQWLQFRACDYQLVVRGPCDVGNVLLRAEAQDLRLAGRNVHDFQTCFHAVRGRHGHGHMLAGW
ncbi:MAG: hypothetical protein QM761_08480 [Pseudoxanthomonas sp.]